MKVTVEALFVYFLATSYYQVSLNCPEANYQSRYRTASQTGHAYIIKHHRNILLWKL